MLGGLAFIVLLSSQSLWIDYQVELLAWAWLATRYVILVVSVFAIYEKWGAEGPSEQPESKWQNAVQLVLFFVVPFFALDALLQTGIVENVVQLIGSLKIF